MKEVRIGGWQLLTIIANLVFGKAIGYSSEVIARRVGNDAWLSTIAAFLAGLALMAANVWLARRFAPEGPTVYIPKLLGRWLGKAVLFALALYLFGAFITSAITIEQHVNDYLMTETPLIVFVLLYTAVAAYGAFLGIEVAARLSVLGLLLTILLNVLMVMGSVDHFHPDRLLPLFDHGLIPVLVASMGALPDIAMATLPALLLLPLTIEPRHWHRLTQWGLILGAVLVLTWPIFEIAVLGPEVTAQYLIACMQMARAAELSIYLHRYEMVMVVLFVYGVLTQSIVCLYSACEMVRAVLPWKVRRRTLIAVAAALTLAPNYYLAFNRDRYGLFLDWPWPTLTIGMALGIPLALCLVALVRGPGQPGPVIPPPGGPTGTHTPGG